MVKEILNGKNSIGKRCVLYVACVFLALYNVEVNSEFNDLLCSRHLACKEMTHFSYPDMLILRFMSE